MTGLRGVDQAMAAAASRILTDEVDSTLRTRYRQLPVMLHTAGLAATYAYVLSKTADARLGTAYRQVADGIRRHVVDRRLIDECTSEQSTDRQFLEAMADCDRVQYTRAAAEVYALAGWLSRLAEARYQAAKADRAKAAAEAAARAEAAAQAAAGADVPEPGGGDGIAGAQQ